MKTLTPLRVIEQAYRHTFTDAQAEWIMYEAQRRTDEAAVHGRGGKYQANSYAGHVTGVSGELVVAEVLAAVLEVVPLRQVDGWDLWLGGAAFEVKTWPVQLMAKAGRGVNTRSVHSVLSRQERQGLASSVLAMATVSKSPDGVPEWAAWWGWTTPSVLATEGELLDVTLYGTPQILTALPWHRWADPDEAMDVVANAMAGGQ